MLCTCSLTGHTGRRSGHPLPPRGHCQIIRAYPRLARTYTVQYTVQFTLYSTQCTVYSVQYTVYIVQCTLYTLHCKVYTVQCKVYTVHCTLHVLYGDAVLPRAAANLYLEVKFSSGLRQSQPDREIQKSQIHKYTASHATAHVLVGLDVSPTVWPLLSPVATKLGRQSCRAALFAA